MLVLSPNKGKDMNSAGLMR